ncbi:MAG: MBL fold metallo-hydrolase [Deltaproteobacteria bacterium]|jgi:L-ascorbate metabolism protein UlaG (beta-lactamase superfamily)|nr:MBL fold metallo-hydrolase [Deltaproteobacteria bacterium]
MLLRVCLALVILAIALFVFVMVYVRLPKFGALPSGKRLERVLASPHYRDGSFRNLSPVGGGVDPKERKSVLEFFSGSGRKKPREPLPVVKSDLKSLKDGELVWFGHSSFLFRLNGRHFLIDPVFSASAAPMAALNRAFKGTHGIYDAGDLPEIDYLFVSHDHWDHLDHPTILAIRPKVKKVFCGLGIGAHFERWGYPAEMLFEGEWGDRFSPEEDVTIAFEHAQHFSGRAFRWNQSMWSAFAIETGGFRVFYSGDGGYGNHFSDIGEKWGGFDLAILEDGQYDRAWADIHLMPEETILASLNLNAKRVIPAHNSKFKIAYHDWDDPLIRARAEAEKKGVRLMTPLIGQVVKIEDDQVEYKDWWSAQK